MKKLKQLYTYFILMRWHLHSIALPFGFLYGYLANVQNWFGLKTAYFEQIVGTQYIWQTILNCILGYGFSWLFEILQSHFYNVNKTTAEFKKNSVPDIWFTGSVFLLGYIIWCLIFEF